VKDWDIDDVFNWAKEITKDQEEAEKLRAQKVDGESLLTLTKTDLVNHPYNIVGGPAAKLAIAIEKLKSPTTELEKKLEQSEKSLANEKKKRVMVEEKYENLKKEEICYEQEVSKICSTVELVFQEDLKNCFLFQNFLYKSPCSVVVQASSLQGKTVALKFVAESHKSCALNEVRKLQMLQHRNVIKLLDSFSLQAYQLFCLVYPFYTCGNEKLNDIGYYLFQFLTALQYCHQQGVVHKDINPTNILYQEHGTNLEVVLADFGVADIYAKELACRAGTLPYMAPEMLDGWGDRYTKSIDIWSAGVTLAELLLGQPLFKEKSEKKLIKEIQQFNWNNFSTKSKIPTDFQEVLGHMLVPERDRWTADQLLSCKLFNKYVQ